VTVSDARAQLSRILTDLSESGAAAAPVLIGAHRKPQGVLLSVAAFESLSGRAARRTAAASATGSIEAEGLHASDAADRDDGRGERWVRREFVTQLASLYGGMN